MNKFNKIFNKNDLISHLDEFYDLYKTKPISDNNGGMKSAHMFSAWYIIKKLKPKFIIESGVWKGLGTWFFEKASPNSKIISIDPSPHFRQYTSPYVDYRTKDFLEEDWSFLPKEETLIFFDDHQNFLNRLKYAQSIGFKTVMTEDNYPYQQGDCYSPKKILANKDFVIDINGSKTWYQKNDDDYNYLLNNIKAYQEMPPIFKSEKTRWGDHWDDEYPTDEPLLQSSDSSKYPIFF